MRFTVEVMTVSGGGGWLAPDTPSTPAAITAVIDGSERRHVVASEERPDVKELGLHPSGFCGFVLDGDRYPWYRNEGPLEIYDSQSNLLLYRREPPHPSEVRLVVLTSPTSPPFDVGQYVSPAVQMIYANAELIGEETVNNILQLDLPSAVVAGALSLTKYEGSMRLRGWQTAFCLVHPLRELAARLLRLEVLGRGAVGSWQTLGDGELIERFAGLDLTDPAAIGRAIQRLTDDQFASLANPTIGLLLAHNKGEMVRPDQFGRALSQLAECALVGVEEYLDDFLNGLDELLGRTDLPRPPRTVDPKLSAVSEALERCRPVQELVHLDLAIYNETRTALERAQDTA